MAKRIRGRRKTPTPPLYAIKLGDPAILNVGETAQNLKNPKGNRYTTESLLRRREKEVR